MTEHEAYAEIRATLEARNFALTGLGLADYKGTVSVHGKPVDIGISFPDVRFAELPIVYLLNRDQVSAEVLAHIEVGGTVCYKSAVGIPLDMFMPGASALRVLEEVQRTLELSTRRRGLLEVIDEYQAHWQGKRLVECLVLDLPKTGTLEVFYGNLEKEGQGVFAVLLERPSLAGFEFDALGKCLICCTDQPLKPVAGLPRNLAEIKTWIEGQVSLPGLSWLKCVDVLAAQSAVFVRGPNAFVGFTATPPNDVAIAIRLKQIRPQTVPRLFIGRPTEVTITRLSVNQCDIKTVTNRSNAMAETLANLRIALIGCGTIGGYLARNLAQCGAGSDKANALTIFDNQRLAEGNIGRHILNFEDIAKPKASAVAEAIKLFHPQVAVYGVDIDALKHWDQLRTYDIVIDATGEWNVQNALNNQFMTESEGRVKALLHCWVFMNGAGVQSFMNLKDDFACFRCLKPQFDGAWRYPAGDESHELNIRPASCQDGAFVPFTVDASIMASALATRMVLDWVAGKPGPRLRTIQVDLERGRNQKPISPTPSKHCPCCSSIRSANG